jgi:hypothetical protein
MAISQNRKYDHQTQRFGWGTKALMWQKQHKDQVQKQQHPKPIIFCCFSCECRPYRPISQKLQEEPS